MFDKLYHQLMILGVEPLLLDILHLTCIWLVIFTLSYFIQMWLVKKRFFLLLSTILTTLIIQLGMGSIINISVSKEVLMYSISFTSCIIVVIIGYRKLYRRFQAK